MDWKNRLYFGDNLDILRCQAPDSSVDLVYLDPPFNSNATYNVLFKEKSGAESAAQITAFEDTWQWSVEAEAVYKEVVTSSPRKLRHRILDPGELALASALKGAEHDLQGPSDQNL
jgi:site-specific DNA-methyltransferase (adenine-specific)